MLIVWFIAIGLALFFFIAGLILRNPKQKELPLNNELKEIMSTDIGYYKVQAALKQARRLGVGVLIHHGKVYSIVVADSPKQGTKEFRDAYQKATEEKKAHR